MAFYKAADEDYQLIFGKGPDTVLDSIREHLIDENRYFKGSQSDPYYDNDSIDIRISADMRTVYVYIRNLRREGFFAQLDFDDSINSIYVNFEGDEVNYINRVLCVSNFFRAVKEAAADDVRDIAELLKKRLYCCLFDVKGQLSIVENGAVVQGSAIEADEISLRFKLFTGFAADEEHKNLLARVNRSHSSGGFNDFDDMDGLEFERFCAGLLEGNGFSDVEVTRGSGDQGIDILATKDLVRYGFQCKCYSADVGNKAVQEALAGKTYYGCHVAVVLTNSYFTPSARVLADQAGVVLWDRDRLATMISGESALIGGGDRAEALFDDDFRKLAESVKNAYDSFSELLTTINGLGSDEGLFGIADGELQQVFCTQIVKFMLWVIDAGNGITDVDAYLVNMYCPADLNPVAVRKYLIEDDGDYWLSDSFGDVEPSIVGTMARAMTRVGVGDPHAVVLPLYENLGGLLVSAGGIKREERASRLSSYLAILNSTIDSQL